MIHLSKILVQIVTRWREREHLLLLFMIGVVLPLVLIVVSVGHGRSLVTIVHTIVVVVVVGGDRRAGLGANAGHVSAETLGGRRRCRRRGRVRVVEILFVHQ